MMTLGFARGCASVVSTLCMQTARKARRFFFSWAFFFFLAKGRGIPVRCNDDDDGWIYSGNPAGTCGIYRISYRHAALSVCFERY